MSMFGDENYELNQALDLLKRYLGVCSLGDKRFTPPSTT